MYIEIESWLHFWSFLDPFDWNLWKSYMKPENEKHLEEEEAVRVIGEGSPNVVAAKTSLLCSILVQSQSFWSSDLHK